MTSVSLSLLVLKTRQLEVVRNFYAALGVDFKPEQHGSGPLHYAGQLESVVLEIYPSEDPIADSLRIGFAIDNLEKAIQALRSVDAAVISKPKDSPWGLRAVVRDPDGRSVELLQKN